MTGGIYYTPSEWARLETLRNETLRVSFVPSFRLIERTRWLQIQFDAPEPLIDASVEQPPYTYWLYYRQSARRAVLVGIKRIVVTRFLESLSLAHGLRVPESVYVNVQALVSLICSKPGSYAATYVHARTSGFGSSVRSISFYGDDVTASSLFREYASALLPHTCGLRDVYANRTQTSEALRVSTEGKVSFYGNAASELLAAEKALGYLNRFGFLLEPRGVGPRKPSAGDAVDDEIHDTHDD
jgi:hypothetical protein